MVGDGAVDGVGDDLTGVGDGTGVVGAGVVVKATVDGDGASVDYGIADGIGDKETVEGDAAGVGDAAAGEVPAVDVKDSKGGIYTIVKYSIIARVSKCTRK